MKKIRDDLFNRDCDICNSALDCECYERNGICTKLYGFHNEKEIINLLKKDGYKIQKTDLNLLEVEGLHPSFRITRDNLKHIGDIAKKLYLQYLTQNSIILADVFTKEGFLSEEDISQYKFLKSPIKDICARRNVMTLFFNPLPGLFAIRQGLTFEPKPSTLDFENKVFNSLAFYSPDKLTEIKESFKLINIKSSAEDRRGLRAKEVAVMRKELEKKGIYRTAQMKRQIANEVKEAVAQGLKLSYVSRSKYNKKKKKNINAYDIVAEKWKQTPERIKNIYYEVYPSQKRAIKKRRKLS